MLSLAENPPVLPPDVGSPAEISGTWFVAHTKARSEKAFAWDLLRAGTPYFLPMVPRVIFSGGRKRRTMLPLFTSYVFFCGNEQDRYRATCTGRLCNVIQVPQQSALVRELAQLGSALRGKAALDLYPFAATGRRCRVCRGPFEGLEGVVIRRDQTTRLVLQVGVLGQGAALEIDIDALEPLDDGLTDAPGASPRQSGFRSSKTYATAGGNLR
jgi:transcriptional antiterminator RfaH